MPAAQQRTKKGTLGTANVPRILRSCGANFTRLSLRQRVLRLRVELRLVLRRPELP